MSIDRHKVTESAQQFVARGQFDKAIAEYQRIVREDPNDVRVLLKVGDLQLQMRDRSAAVETYSRVAAIYDSQGVPQKSAAVLRRILEIEPTQVALHTRLTELYLKLSLPNEAIQQLDQLAQHYARSENNDAQMAIYQQMVKIDPNSIAAHIRFAELLSRLSRNELAATEFETACRLLREAVRFEDWARVAERLFFHRPNDSGLARDLAEFYLKKDDAKRALPKLQVAYKGNPRDISVLEMLADAFRALGQLPKTVQVFKEIAKIHQETGRTKERNEFYQKVLEISPTDSEAREALKTSSRMVRRPVSSMPPPAVTAPQRPSSLPPSPPLPQAAQEVDSGDDVMIVEDDEDVVFDLKPSIPSAPTPPPAGLLNPQIPPPAPLPVISPPLPQGAPRSPLVPPPPASSAAPPIARPQGSLSPPAKGSQRPSRRAPTTSIPFTPRTSIPAGGPSAEAMRLIGEAEIFLKYGLRAKAAAHLNRAAELDPTSVDLHVRLRDLFASLNDGAGLFREALVLAELWAPTDPVSALAEVSRALEIDPEHEGARALYARLQGEDGGPDETMIDESEVVIAEAPLPAGNAFDDQTDFNRRTSETHETYASFDDHTERGHAVDEVVIDDEAVDEQMEYSRVHHQRSSMVEELPMGMFGATQSTAAARREIEAGLDEAEFFVTQGLYEDARETLEGLLAVHPNHPLVLERWEEIAQMLEMQTDSADAGFGGLVDQLAQEVEGMLPVETPLDASFDEETVFAQFKTEMGRSVSVEDCDTHYDLGVAYKEMGLFDDAIGEFKIAAANPARQCLGETMIGLCLVEKGDVATAIDHFKRGLQAAEKTEREELALYFEIGAAYEHLGDLSEALYFFQKVDKRDPGFRGVHNRAQRLQVHVRGVDRSGAGLANPNATETNEHTFDDLLKD